VTESIDLGSGTIRVRNLATTTTENTLLVADGNGRFMTRDVSSLNLSPWVITAGEIGYDGSVGIGIAGPTTETLDIGTGTIRVRNLANTAT